MLHHAEVQEGDLAAAVEDVVTGMRVAVERVHLVQAAEDEPVQGLPRQVTLVLRPADDVGEPRAGDELAGDDAPGRQSATIAGTLIVG